MSQTLDSLLSEWGFSSDAPDFVVEHASHCLECASYRIGEIVVALKIATKEQVEAALKNKPANVLSLEYLSQAIPSIRAKSLQILSISRKIPFFPKIEEKLVAKAVQSLGPEARAKLDASGAVCIKTPDDQFMIVFSEINNLLVFSQAGVIEKTKDPIRQSLGEEPLYGLAIPAAVAKASKVDSETAVSVVSSAAQDNYWSALQAKTEAERTLARILDEALDRRATDIEFAPLRDGTTKIRFRIFGDLTQPNRNVILSPEVSKEITNFLISRSRAGDGGRLRRPGDGQITYKNSATETFMRCSFIPADRFGLDFDMISSSIRLMPRTSRSITLTELNLAPVVLEEVSKSLLKSQGLIILAGPTNSGKSTTIAGVVGEHVKLFGNTKKRLSLEDPVERYIDGITQISVDNNFAELLRALLRHDPDMIWVGEIRDAFSAAACVRASTSGHVVLSTVHANDSILAFRAVANYLRKDTGEASGAGASLFDLAESIGLLVGQRLVKKLCPHCKQPHSATKDELFYVDHYLKAEGQESLIPDAHKILRGQIFKANPSGCPQCSGSGFVGEMPINELLPASREVKDIFAASESRLDYNALAKHRVITLAQSALNVIKAGHTELSSLFV